MTSQGSATSRFDRACASGNPNLAIAALLELPRPVQLRDALRLVLVLAASGDERFDRAAARFAARLAVKRRLSLSQAQLALAALQTLNASDPGVGAEALCGLLERCGEVEAASCLDRWLVGRGD